MRFSFLWTMENISLEVPSPSVQLGKSLRKCALVRRILPFLSIEAIAIGILLKKRLKRIFAIVPDGSPESQFLRETTTVRLSPGLPSHEAKIWCTIFTGIPCPLSIRRRSKSNVVIF
ncbi:hypothetical protein FXW24_01600 [Candidatus Liberibacter asiaticus]|nr:hypothetical protein FXW31_03175 [Candidatus Liberibacter asiaticus]KAE9517776.1 hypothetical protein FXW24_01600 [Candidatus Liberibacter asiaticus]